MTARIAWGFCSLAFEASKDNCFPAPMRGAFFQFGVAWFWTALALEGRAWDVWRELRAQKALLRHASFHDHMRLRFAKPVDAADADAAWPTVWAWSLPDDARMQRLGLGSTWVALCPYCHSFHTHSPGEGSRAAHCRTPADRSVYVLRFGGELPRPLWTQLRRSVEADMPRLLSDWPEPGTGDLVAVLGLKAA